MKNRVAAAVRYRNFIAHTDWIVGAYDSNMPRLDADEDYDLADPSYRRLKRMDKEGKSVDADAIPIAELDAKTDALVELLNDVTDFGLIVLTRVDLSIGPDRRFYKADEPFRVRDVFRVDGSGVSARVVRDGPRATELYSMHHTPL